MSAPPGGQEYNSAMSNQLQMQQPADQQQQPQQQLNNGDALAQQQQAMFANMMAMYPIQQQQQQQQQLEAPAILIPQRQEQQQQQEAPAILIPQRHEQEGGAVVQQQHASAGTQQQGMPMMDPSPFTNLAQQQPQQQQQQVPLGYYGNVMGTTQPQTAGAYGGTMGATNQQMTMDPNAVANDSQQASTTTAMMDPNTIMMDPSSMQNMWAIQQILMQQQAMASNPFLMYQTQLMQEIQAAQQAGLFAEASSGSGVPSVKLKHAVKKKPKGKPKRPLSAYNIFFKEERERILKEKEAEGEQEDEGTKKNKEGDDKKKKPDKKRKTSHGKVGFEALARTVGTRWKALGDEEMEYYKEQAAIDTKRYKREMEKFMTKQRKETEAKLAVAGTGNGGVGVAVKEDDGGGGEPDAEDATSAAMKNAEV